MSFDGEALNLGGEFFFVVVVWFVESASPRRPKHAPTLYSRLPPSPHYFLFLVSAAIIMLTRLKSLLLLTQKLPQELDKRWFHAKSNQHLWPEIDTLFLLVYFRETLESISPRNRFDCLCDVFRVQEVEGDVVVGFEDADFMVGLAIGA